ncbi:MAG TPA: carboxypeptidase regulatory-like domain-containing protein [Terriglobales bacterium]|nr:carboxypeptidase regulatory-like domain-containing protein [Terriglobales bacterium]
MGAEMIKKLFVGSVVLALCFMCSSIAFGQSRDTTRGSLGGTIVDTSQAAIPDATVTATGPLGNQTQTSKADGTFLFTALVPGVYSVKAEKDGFQTVTLTGIEVLINNTANVSVQLPVGAVTTSIEVTGATTNVDVASSSINSTLTSDFLNAIPVQRNVSSVMLLAPGVVSGLRSGGGVTGTAVGSSATDANPSISGASGLENLYVADGVVLNDPAFGGLGGFSTVYGAIGVGITPEFVQQEEIKTAGFEPQYGHATGGVVQIVTKSGSNQMHGTIGGYFESPSMQSVFANKDDFHPLNLIGRHLDNGEYEGDFELGGYVPGFKNHLFYFGAFDPTFFNDFEAPAIGSGLYTLYHGQTNRRTNTYAYAGKLTWQVNGSMSIESSVFGDPSHTNHAAFSTLNADNTSGNSKWDFGTRNWDTRAYGAISPTWTADFAYTYSWNKFIETPADTSIYPIEDQTQTGGDGFDVNGNDLTANTAAQRGDYQAQGLGTGILVNYTSHAQSLTFDTTKIFRFAGQHSLSVGYFWQYPVYDDVTKYSFNTYTIPGDNATSSGGTGTSAGAGKTSDAALQLQLAPGTCKLCPLMNVSGFSVPVRVALYQVRGRFDGGISHNTGKYHAAYANDSWQMGSHATLNLGLRWEQQRLTGSAAHTFFNDQWSPRIGFIVSPNPDSKVYVDFDRLAFILPLDMAVRELSSEDDNLNEYWAPASSGGMVTLNKYGTVNFVPDQAHLLNGATGGIAKTANIEIQSGGEPFTPGIRMEYNDEFVVGAEHKFSGGFFGSVRYVDRRMKRVVEDEVGASVEQLTALAFNGGSYSYVIGNPSANQAIFVTPNEKTFGAVDQTTPAAICPGANPGTTTIDGFDCALETATNNPSKSNAQALEGYGYPSACIGANFVPTPFNAPNMQDTFGNTVGSACFPSVNQSTWSVPNPKAGKKGQPNNIADPNALFGGEYFPAGCPYCHPGLYPDVARNYQAVEFELNKSFRNNWQLQSNFRIGRLVGNYEGAFRNDNDQSDPGISSLFDLTNGDLGLLGQQLGIGPLNTDRRYVLNILPSYTISEGFAKNLELGTAVSVLSGVPLTTLAAQEIYGNAGEVPLHGRGDLGRSPVTGTVGAHLMYPIKFGETKQLKLTFDAFNIANTKRFIRSTQDVDLSFQVLNQDFNNHIPLSFVPPFSARFSVLFTF